MKIQNTLITCALLCLPTAVSAVAFDISDTVAGLATEVVVSELQPHTQATAVIGSPLGDSQTFTLNAGDHGIAHTWLSGADLEVAGQYTVSLTDALGATTNTEFTVHPDTVDTLRSGIEVISDAATKGQEIVVTVVLMDRFGNALAGRSAELISSRVTDLVQPISRETDFLGEQKFLVRASEDGVLTLRAVDLISGDTLDSATEIAVGSAMDGIGGPLEGQLAYSAPAYNAQGQFYRGSPYAANLMAPPAPVYAQPQYAAPAYAQPAYAPQPTYNPPAAAFAPSNPFRAQLQQEPPRLAFIQMEILGQEREEVPSVEQYKAQSMLLTAVDQYGNRYYDFEGNVYLATTDPDATLPSFGMYTFAFEDEGQLMSTLGLKFATPGRQVMVLTERPDEIPENYQEDALGFLEIEVEQKQVVIQPEEMIEIYTPVSEELFNTTTVEVTGHGPEFINIVVEGGLEPIESETNRQGDFAVTVELNPEESAHLITVYDKDAPANTSEVVFAIDVTPPVIDRIAFTPENPVEGTDVLVVVDTEPGLEAISIDINGETFELMTTDPESGKYQKLFSAAPEAGAYPAVVTATDSQGNTGLSEGQLQVALKGLPIVQNVVAEAAIDSIGVSWEPAEGVDAYRIFVGTTPEAFDFDLASGQTPEGIYTLDTDRPTAAATVAGLRPGATYYFAVTALKDGRQSESLSNIASATVLGVELEVTPGDGSLFLEWNSLTQDIPLSNFLLEYSVDPAALTDPLREAELEIRTLNGQLRAYTLRDLINGITYYLKLTPITTTGERMEELSTDGQGTPIGAGFTAGNSDPVPFDLRASAPPPGPGVNPPPPPKAKNMDLSDQGVPLWLLWTVLGATVALFWMHIRRRKDADMTHAFLQAMESRYHR